MVVKANYFSHWFTVFLLKSSFSDVSSTPFLLKAIPLPKQPPIPENPTLIWLMREHVLAYLAGFLVERLRVFGGWRNELLNRL